MDSWSDLVYAKPGDTVSWVHCYYPGIQEDYNTKVSASDPPHSSTVPGCADTVENYTTMSELWTWDNYFKVKSSGGGLDYKDYQAFDIDGKTDVKWSNGASNIDPNAHPGGSEVTPNFYQVGTVDDSETLTETITTGFPSSISIDVPTKHEYWACNRREDCGECGTHKCNCSSGEDG